jgi:hypothetical protein
LINANVILLLHAPHDLVDELIDLTLFGQLIKPLANIRIEIAELQCFTKSFAQIFKGVLALHLLKT